MQFALISSLLILNALTWLVSLYHLSTHPPPKTEALSPLADRSQFIDKRRYGVHQLLLFGSNFERGFKTRQLAEKIIDRQEDNLIEEFYHFFPSPIFRQIFMFASMRWFWGAEKFMEPSIAEEIAGVVAEKHAKYEYLLDNFTREFAYHGIHEIGQMFVDVDREDMGCTVLAARSKEHWILARSFDFELGRVFDEDKVIKWNFPNNGYSYLSVIWPGMVGSVTGINENYIYVSINAAGSDDRRRFGTPSTFVVTKALRYSANLEEAIKIISDATVFISDIYVVLDMQSNRLVKIEKTPRRTRVVELNSNSAVTNHLTHPDFAKDKTNSYRYANLTTKFRFERGAELVNSLSSELESKTLEEKLLSFLRDKNGLHHGNRRAIDALIASHAVLVNSETKTIFVSRGPAISGAFSGFDLQQSFSLKRPIYSYSLPADPLVSKEYFYQFKDALKQLSVAEKLLQQERCETAERVLIQIQSLLGSHNKYLTAKGKVAACRGNFEQAKSYWQQALTAKPAYQKNLNFLQERL